MKMDRKAINTKNVLLDKHIHTQTHISAYAPSYMYKHIHTDRHTGAT